MRIVLLVGVGLLGAACTDFPPYECTRCFDASSPVDASDGGGDADGGSADAGLDAGVVPRAVSIARGLADRHSCLIGEDQSLWCWGDNSYGQLGIAEPRAFRPRKVMDGADEVVTGFEHTCVRKDSQVWCFGNNKLGQVGVGRVVDSVPAPELVMGLEEVVQLSAGTGHTCALVHDGRVFCWGGVLPAQANRYSPELLVGTPANITYLETGSVSTGMIADGELWMVGANGYVLGDGTTDSRLTPVHISLPLPIVDLDIGDLHACAVLADSSVRCWGLNGEGSLGIPLRYNVAPRPTELDPPFAGASAISCGFRNTCIVTTSSTTRCFGPNGYGTTGSTIEPENTIYVTPQLVQKLEAPEQIEVYWLHACALSAGTVRCWGDGQHGQLGNNTLSSSSHPVLIWP